MIQFEFLTFREVIPSAAVLQAQRGISLNGASTEVPRPAGQNAVRRDDALRSSEDLNWATLEEAIPCAMTGPVE